MASPIADLSYRNYDGVLSDTRFRWWVITKAQIMVALKKRAIWWYVVLSAGYYVLLMGELFVFDMIAQATPPGRQNPLAELTARLVWKDQFVHGFSWGQIWYLAIALVLGAGAIANDNRANALLVYLSKPCDKRDYLFGKWFGVFLPLLIVSAIPSLVFFFYGAMSYRDAGFLTADSWMLPKLILVLSIGAAFHASVVIGVSSLFNQGRMAGAVYAGFYFISNFFTQLMVIAFLNMTGRGRHANDAPAGALESVSKLYYASIDGLNIGMAKGIFGTDGTPSLGIPSGVRSVPMPPLWMTLGPILLISALMMYIAWRRIRPVEIVG